MNESILLDYTEIQTRSIDYLTVVVHLIHRTAIDSISEAQIKSQIEVLNEDFSMTNSNFNITPEVFKNVAANAEIKFCLASIDPDGNPTSGITYTKTNIDDIGTTEFYYLSGEGGRNAWDQDKYINIWVCDMGTSGVAGVGTAPGTAVPAQRDGILVNFRYFGRVGVAEQSFPHDKGRICVHEMGHYFGLPHIFGSLGGACNDDDGFTDTPLQDTPSFACPAFPNPDMCTQNNGVMFMNFMDYTDDECMTMFTKEQKNHMKIVLNGPRSDLKGTGQESCIVDVINEPESESWTFGPNPSSNSITINDEMYKNPNVVEIYDLTGRQVFWTKVRSSNEIISTNQFPKGLYYLRYKKSVRKLLIQN